MIIGVPTEQTLDERRVALVPAAVAALSAAGHRVLVQRGAGDRAGFTDAGYEEHGAEVKDDARELFASAALVLAVNSPASYEGGPAMLHDGQLVVGLLDPFGTPEGIAALADRGVTAMALELLPRISRAQQLDALTSMATIAGYKAVLVAAHELNRMFPLMMTAAGTITPAKVLVIGAGVAGLQAIATAHRLGAVVEAYDVRPDVREQVESLNARFVEFDLATAGAEDAGGYAQQMDDAFYDRQRELLGEVVGRSDVVITTAAVPGASAPLLVTAGAVARMEPGSVIVDLAAPTGGNCELTQPGETVEVHGVKIVGPLNLASSVPHDASQMYSRNVVSFLGVLLPEAADTPALADEIVRETVTTRAGEVVHARVRELLGLPVMAG
jgi:NAD(P) transhydrogenase subunit alpha